MASEWNVYNLSRSWPSKLITKWNSLLVTFVGYCYDKPRSSKHNDTCKWSGSYSEVAPLAQGALTSVLEYEWKIKLPLSRVFCGGLCEFLIRARGKLHGLLVGGLEPRSLKSGRIRSFTEHNKVTRDETSHFFRRMSLPVGGNGSKMWRGDRKSKCVHQFI